MERQVPQQTTKDAYNINVNEAIQQQKLNALSQYNQNQPSFMPQYGGQQEQQAGYLPSPLYSPGSNPFQTFQTIQEAQQQQISDNIGAQRKIRAYQSQGYDAVLAGLTLAKKASKKQNYLGDTFPKAAGFFDPTRRDTLAAYTGEALSRVDQRYANILNIPNQTAGGLKKAGLIMAQRGLEDMLVGKIVNSTSVSPMLDANVLEQTARAQAKAIIDAYSQKLPNGTIKNERDIYKLMDMIDIYHGDNTTLFELQDNLQNIALEYGYAHSYIGDIKSEAVKDQREMLTTINNSLTNKDEEYTPVGAHDLPAPVQTAIGSVVGLPIGIIKGVASPLKTLAVDIGLNGFAAFADAAHAIFTLDPNTDYVDKIGQFSSWLDHQLDSKSTSESVGKGIAQLGIMMAIGSAALPTASLIGQLATGAAISTIGFPMLKAAADGIVDITLDMLMDDESQAKPVIANMAKAVADALLLYLPVYGQSHISKKNNTLLDVVEYSPQALETLNKMDTYTRDLFMNELANVSIEKVMSTISDRNIVEQAQQTAIPSKIIYAVRNALSRNAGLRESVSFEQFATNEANKATRLQIIEAVNTQRQALGRQEFTGNSSFSTLLQETVNSIKQTISEKYNAALGEPRPTASQNVLPTRILQSIRGNNQLKWAKVGVINGLQRIIDNGDVRKAFGVEKEATMIPFIQQLKVAINDNKFDEATKLMGKELRELPHTAAHHIRSQIGKLYNEDPSQYNYNQGITELKNSYDGIVDSLIPVQEQQVQYATAQYEWGLLKSASETLEQFTEREGGTPVNLSTQAVNKMHEVTRDLSQIIAKFSLNDRQKAFAKELSILNDEFVTFSVVEKLQREPHLTATEIHTLLNKVAGSQIQEATKSPILHSLRLYEQVMKSFTSDIGRTQTGVHKKQNILTEFFVDSLYALANKFPTVSAAASLLIKQFNVPANQARSIGIIADVLHAHPKMYGAIQAALDSKLAQGFTKSTLLSLLPVTQRWKDDDDE
ncbi:MAG: hypothetical protein ACRCY4_09605 [Brevinema sp.]